MGLRETAEADLAVIMEDRVTGNGWDITLTNPAGVSHPFVGFSTDIGYIINPETGQPASGRQATVAIRLTTLDTFNFGMPKVIQEEISKPWLVTFNDLLGNVCVFKVVSVMPDRTVGLLILVLEVYKP